MVEELHRNARKNYPRRSYVMRGINDTFQADLVEMIPYARQNKGYRYILMVIDVFSKRAWAKPLKNKTGEETTKAMATIFADHPNHIPRNLHTDRGKEFYNHHFQTLMKKHGINHYSTGSKMKASIVERLNRTIMNKIWRQFSLQGSNKWLNNLQPVIDEYNSSHHRTIQMRPCDVTKSNEKELLKSVYNPRTHIPLNLINNIIKKSKFQTDDYVRISKHKTVFEKGYTPNWSAEIFQISKVLPTRPITYLIRDSNDEQLSGCFYSQELQKTKHPDVYLIERVLKRKGNKLQVKWLGIDKARPQWIDKKNVV